jgi:hypothetical protein
MAIYESDMGTSKDSKLGGMVRGQTSFRCLSRSSAAFLTTRSVSAEI